MIIAINITSKAGDDKQILSQYFLLLAQQLPAHKFVFITNQKHLFQKHSGTSISVIQSGPAKNKGLAWKVWYDYTLPSLAKKIDASIIIHTDNIVSLRTKTKQVMFMKDVSFLYGDDGELKKDARNFSKKLLAYFKKTTTLWLHTNFVKTAIETISKTTEEKATVLPAVIDASYKPIDWKEKESIKERYTSGKEYFLADIDITKTEQLRNLLKAFSLFKKRQKSNMQLVICVSTASTEYEKFTADLDTYKYKTEVTVIKDADHTTLLNITSSAYAFVSTVLYNDLPLHCLDALQAEVPLLVANTHINIEFFNEAALYVQPENINDVAAKMMHVFKDESSRAELIEKGKAIDLAGKHAIASIKNFIETTASA